MSYKNQFYLEAELEEDELTEDEDIEKELDEDDDDNYDDENGYDTDGDDDELENDEFDTDVSDEDEENDISDFGSDESDINNDYDRKDSDMLNKLISSETSAVQEYLDANMETSNDNLRRLYVDIANEERFHIEQLMYAKAKLTGEKYEPSDPEVKREYEELCNSGMDEESAMSTACDKCAISRDRQYTQDSIQDMIDDINDFTEAFVESTINNLALASFENTQDVYMEYADIYMEEIQNISDKTTKADGRFHPIRFIINAINGILKFIHRITLRITQFIRRAHAKNTSKLRWIQKHGISSLFKEGVWLYLWSEQGNHRIAIDEATRYIDLMGSLMMTIQASMYEKKEAVPVKGKHPKAFTYKSIAQGVNILQTATFTKEKVIVTESNQDKLEKIFFGVTDSTTTDKSDNIYNWLEQLSTQYEELGKHCDSLLERLKDLEGNYDSAYSKNPKLYRTLVNSTKDLTKEFTRFSKYITHDLSKVMDLNNGLYELMKEFDDTKAYNRMKSDEAKEDIKNGEYNQKKRSPELSKYYPKMKEDYYPGNLY